MRSEAKRKILEHLTRHKADTAVVIARDTDIPKKRVSNTLQYLKQCGLLENIGFTWRILG